MHLGLFIIATMYPLKINPRLQGDLGEVVFEHYCRHHGKKEFAFLHIKTSDIFKSFLPNNILPFQFENKTVRVEIPADIEDEIRKVCKPSNHNHFSPTFTPDFLSVPMGDFFKDTNGQITQIKEIPFRFFNWIEVKTNESQLTANQAELRKNSKIGLKVFRIRAEFPKVFEVFNESSE